MSYEFIARLPPLDDEVRWLVRDVSSDALRVVLAIEDSDPGWLHEVDHSTTAWLAFTHPKVARVHATAWLDGQLMVTVLRETQGHATRRDGRHVDRTDGQA